MTRFLTAPIMYALLALLLAASACAGIQTLRLATETTAHQKTKTKTAETLQHLAELTAQVQRDVRAREQGYARAAAKNQADWNKEQADAIAAKNVLIADLRARVARLQPWWEATGTATCPGGAAAAGPGADEAAELRYQGAADLIGNADAADADLRWFQSTLIETRKACAIDEVRP